MFDTAILYQAGFYASLDELNANASLMVELTKAFSEYGFIPSNSRLVNLDQPQHFILRPKLISEGQEWEIDFEPGRFLIKSNRTPNIECCSSEEFQTKATKFLEILTTLFPYEGTRLSFVAKGLLSQIESDLLNKFNCSGRLMAFYKNHSPVEWISRQNSRLDIHIMDYNEQINVITELSRIQGLIVKEEIETPIDRVQVLFDINTVAGNRTPRFHFAEFDAFISSSISKAKEILCEIEESCHE